MIVIIPEGMQAVQLDKDGGPLIFRVEGFYLGTWAAKNSMLKVLSVPQRAQKLLGADLQSAIQKRFPSSSAQERLEFYQKNMTAGKVLLVINPKEVSVAR